MSFQKRLEGRNLGNRWREAMSPWRTNFQPRFKVERALAEEVEDVGSVN